MNIGVWSDPDTGDFGCYTNKAIIKYLTIKESRKIWKIYLAKNEFDLAKQYCRVSGTFIFYVNRLNLLNQNGLIKISNEKM